MNKKLIIFIVFILLVLLQLFVPSKMIFDREDVLVTGKEYKFKTKPVDPNDPFRGKYISLGFEENMVKGQDENNWKEMETVYVLLSTDATGFAKIKSISKVKPPDKVDFVKAKISYLSTLDRRLEMDSLNHFSAVNNNIMIIEYPFDRFYIDEFKAPIAEKVYMESLSDSTNTVYALVKIKDGEAVLEDLFINEKSIREIAKK